MLRLIHTADWHLGHTLHGYDRGWEHDRFFQWLLTTIMEKQVDILLVAGDIFDTANPSTAALTLYYQFIAQLCRNAPQLQIILIAGNHDSAPRLEAPGSLLETLGVRVVGTMPRLLQDYDNVLIPLRNKDGDIEAWCGAVPFLRLADLPQVEGEDILIAGVETIYQRVLTALNCHRQPHQGVVLTGHCYMVGGDLSEGSERKILLGNQHALPVGIFGEEVTYVALGHLHLAQKVAGRQQVRYSGSPIPMSMSERGYQHQVLLVEMEGSQLLQVTPLPIPRSVAMMRIPDRQSLPLEEILSLLKNLPTGKADDHSPLLEVVVLATTADTVVRQRIEEALEGKAVRLAKFTLHRPEEEGSETSEACPSLTELAPEEVFKKKYWQEYSQEPPDTWLAAFHELVDLVGQEGSE